MPSQHKKNDDLEAEPLMAPSVIGAASTDSTISRKQHYVSGLDPAPTGFLGVMHSILDSPFQLIGWYQMLLNEYGYKLLVLLFASQHVMKGLVNSIAGQSGTWLFRAYKVQGPRMQIFQGVVGLPWALKPIIGMVSDLCPIGGYNKAPYILITSLFSVISFCMIGFGSNATAIEMTVVGMFLISLQMSTCDLLTEAKYAEQLNEKPEYGPDLMTYVWSGINAGGIVALLCVGWIISTYGPRTAYLIAILPAGFILYPTLKNYMEETVQTPEEIQRRRTEMLEQKEAFFLCVLMLFATIFLTVIGMATSNLYVHLAGALTTMLVVLVAFSVTLRPVIAKINAFFLVQTSLGVAIGGSTFYFYTDDETQYPEGPHFSAWFFTTVLGFVGSICSLIGLALYNKYMKNWTYRSLLLVSNLLLSVLSLLDILIYTRYNLVLGIPDHLFVLGSSVSGTIISQWQWMPGVVMLSQMCPKGMEATMYALLAGCHNLGNTLSEYLGAFILEQMRIQPGGEPNESHQFDNLPYASAIATLLPLMTLALLPWLIPDAKQTDKLMEDDDRSATEGSLWQQWTGRTNSQPAAL